MVSFEEARSIILDSVQPVGIERTHLLEATGRVLAEDAVAPWDMPLWDNSAMDGYAVRWQDCMATPCRLRVTGFLPAGAKADGIRVEAGCAVRIMTGAPTPDGCDAVVPVEETDDGQQEVTLLEPVKKGQHIRCRAEDVSSGVVFVKSGTVIRPPEVNMLAGFGMAMVPVYRCPTVAILSTGDELVELGRTPGPGEIINSNTLSLAAAVREAGCIPRIIGIARDNRESHLEKLSEGLKADILITSAGVSAGDCDLVRDILEELGAKQMFWKVGIKPGGADGFRHVRFYAGIFAAGQSGLDHDHLRGVRPPGAAPYAGTPTGAAAVFQGCSTGGIEEKTGQGADREAETRKRGWPLVCDVRRKSADSHPQDHGRRPGYCRTAGREYQLCRR